MAITDTERTEVLELLGSPEYVDRELEEFRKSARVLSSQYRHLIEQYPNEWVAAYDGKIVARGPTLPSVLQQLDEQGLQREQAAVRFAGENHRTMIL
jgi:hypothetical protein